MKDAADLAKHPELYPPIFDSWIKSGQLGCLFAVHMVGNAKNPAKWLTIAIDDELDTQKLSQRLNSILLAAKAPDALSVIFPRLDTPSHIATLITTLCTDPTWGWEQIQDNDSSRILVGLRWRLPAGEAGSWVLGFAPYSLMPFTRQAPFTALVMRTQYSTRPIPEGKLDYVHLADFPPYSKATHPEMWKRTEEAKKTLVPDVKERMAARAKVTFVLPTELGSSLPKPERYPWSKQEK